MISINIVPERMQFLSSNPKKLIKESCKINCKILNYNDLTKYLNECKKYNDYISAINSLKSENLSPIEITHGATYIAENIIPFVSNLDDILNPKFVKIFSESYYDIMKNCNTDIHDFYKPSNMVQSEPCKIYKFKNYIKENKSIDIDLLNSYVIESTENEDSMNDAIYMLEKIIESSMCSYESCNRIYNFLDHLYRDCNKEFNYKIPSKNDFNKNKALIESYNIIYDAAKKYRAADRVIKNHKTLSNRYNFDKVVTENSVLFTDDQSDCIYEMCKLMDTFHSLSFESRYNMYLENTLYLLNKNGINYNLNNIAESVTDYIMINYPMNESNMDSINKVLRNNIFFKDTEYANSFTMKNDNDIINEYVDIINESVYYESIADYSEVLPNLIDNYLHNTYTSGLKYYKDWVNESKEESKNKAEEQSKKITVVSKIKDKVVSSAKQGIADGVKDNKDDESISNLINNFKKQDEKDVGKLKSLIIKIYSKDPDDAIKNTPSILNIIRIMLTVGVVAFTPLVGLILIIVDQVIALNINRKQADKLLNYFYKERDKIEDRLYDASGDKREKLDTYLKKLNDAIDKLENHKDNLKSDVEVDDDSDEIINDMAYILSMCESAEIIDKFDINIITNAIKEYYDIIPLEFIDSITELSLLVNEVVNKNKILESLEFAYNDLPNKVSDMIQITNIGSCLSENINKIKYCENNYEDFEVPIIEFADVLRSLQINLAQENCLHEGMSFKNTFKLAAINIKDKITNLSDKEKSACKTINAMANNLKNKIETSITNSNREAVIKGSIMPSFSSLIKMILVSGAAIALKVNIGIIVTGWIGIFACKAIMTNKERAIVLDDIESEIEVIEKKLAIAEREEDFDTYKNLLKLSKKLKREAQRIKYKISVSGRNILNKD